MSEKNKNKTTKKQTPKEIAPDRYLIDYLKQALRLTKVRDKKQEGGKVTVTDDRDIKYNDDRKVDILDKVIFKSMANLIYFFKFLNLNPELIDKFGDDITDLLGLDADRLGCNTFDLFLDALIGWNIHGDYPNPKFQYRYRLLSLMQRAIWLKAMEVYGDEDGQEYRGKEFSDSVLRDFLYAERSLAVLDKNYEGHGLGMSSRKDKGIGVKSPNRIITFPKYYDVT